MNQLIQKSFALFALLSLAVTMNAAGLNRDRVTSIEAELEPYMQLTDNIALARDLPKMENKAESATTPLAKLQSAIFLHEIAANFQGNATYDGYAQKSYDILTALAADANTEAELMPFITAYQGSAQVLMGEETGSKKNIRKGIKTLDASVENYRKYSFVSRFLRGSTFERLDLRKSVAREDFTMLVVNYEFNNEFANNKVMSHSYTAWANLHQDKVYRDKAISYLKKAISLDPKGSAGKQKAESLLKEMKS